MRKNRLAFLGLSLLLALVMALPALGEAQLEKVYEIYEGKFLGNTTLVAFSTESYGLLGIMDEEGKVLVPNAYYRLEMRNPFGYIEALKGEGINAIGVIDKEGNVLVPTQYGVIEMLSRDWIMGITLEEAAADNYDYKVIFGGGDKPYYKAATFTFHNMKTGKEAGSLTREQFDKAYGYPGFLVVKGVDGVNTVYDEAFTPLGTAEQLYQGYLFEKNGEQWDVKRAGDGQLIFSTPYQVMDYNRDDETFRVKQAEKEGRLDLEGNVLVPPVHERLIQLAGDHYRAKETYDGKEGVADLSGKPLIPFKYDEVLTTYVRGLSLSGQVKVLVDGFAPVLLDGKIGFVDANGQETVPPSYAKDAVKQFGNTLTYSDVSGKKMLVAADGKVSELDYKEMNPLYNANSGRYFYVKDAEGKSTIIDWHGNALLPLGDYSEYASATSTDGTFMLAKNAETRMTEGYKIK